MSRHIRLLILLSLIICRINGSNGQCPVSSFSIPASVCIDETIEPSNSSIGAVEFEWDFCSGDFENMPVASSVLTNPLLNFSFDFEIVSEAGLWYGFAVSRTGDRLIRLDFGNSIENSPTITNLGTISGFNDPNAISFYNEGGTWYGLVGNLSSTDIVRLQFGSGLDNSPTSEVLAGVISFSSIGDMELISDGSNVYCFIATNDNGDLNRLDFGNSIANSPTYSSSNIAGLDALTSITFTKDCDDFYGLITGFTEGEVHRINFGSDLGSVPVSDQISIGGISFTNASHLKLVNEGTNYYGIVQLLSGSLIRLEFGDSMNNIPTGTELGNLGVLGSSVFAFDLISDSSQYYGLSIGFSSNTLYRVDFSTTCQASIPFSTSESATTSYSQSGNYNVTLKTVDENGGVDYSLHSINVTTDSAPQISFTTSSSRCILNPVSFTSSLTGLTSYSWDFNNDGIEDSDLENPTFDFSSLGSGSYTIRLDVTDGVCSNFYEEEITVFDPPPSPDFDYSATSLCTNSEINFLNTTNEMGFGSELTYEWDFNGEGTSTVESPTFTFTTSGLKTVRLTTIISDCEEVYEEVLDISTGPSSSFSYTSNCFGEPILFTDESVGGVSNIWNFGDGSDLVNDESNPSHTFSANGTYTIELTTINSEGCQTVFSNNIEISDQPLASFSSIGNTENLPVSFTGVDNTLPDDSVVLWNWNFDELGTSNLQSPEFVFSSPGDYTITLEVETRQGCTFSTSELTSILDATCPISSFSITDSLCINENFQVTNNTVNAITYEWDFCSGDFENLPVASVLSTNNLLNFSFDIEILEEDEMWFGFLVSRTGDKLIRLNFGSSLSNIPTIDDLGEISGFNDPNAISFYQESNVWYALVGNLSSSDLVFLEFGLGLDELPTSEILSDVIDFASVGDVELVTDGNNLYGFLATSDNGDLHRLDFGSSILNSPTLSSMDFIGLNALTSLSIIIECDSYYGLMTGFSEGEIHKMSFGSDLASNPTIDQIVVEDINFTNPGHIELISEGANFYGIVQLLSGSVIRIEFGESMENIPSATDLSNLEVMGSSVYGFDLVSDSSRYYGYSIGFSSNDIYRIDFSEACNASIPSSHDFEPIVNYNQDGTYQVTLKALDEEGRIDYDNQTVIVNTELAPSGVFALDNSRCITNSNTFTPSTPGLTSYSWDFDNDGIEDSNEESPSYQFQTAGTYTVRVDVGDGTCNNFYEEEVIIYEEPPVPDFEITSALFCLNTPIDFSNITDDASYAGPLEYNWTFNGDEGTADTKDATFSFSTPGDKVITLTSSIPGCTQTFERTITINEGPTAGFSATSVCQNEAMHFTNTSTEAISYMWDFGDGFTSTSENPDHVFVEAGNFNVSLTVVDADGCDNTAVVEVAVADLPQVNFDFEIPCSSSSGVSFTDLSTVDNADVVSWRWTIDGEDVSTEQNPTLSFEETGVVNISLAVTSSHGCESTHSEDVEILPSPSPDFSTAIGCLGEETVFEDITSFPEGSIVSWLWFIEGVSYTTEDVNHVFSNPGNYDITLEVTGQNFCSESITRSVEILQLPTVDFSVIGDCDNELIEIQDTSTEFADQIISRSWRLNDEVVGNGSELFLSNLESNTYTLMLELETASGCTTSLSETLEINGSPTASFTSSRAYGLPNDRLTFTNNSSGATTYQWLLDDAETSNDPVSENLTFSDPGTYSVSLVAQNSLGCLDTTSQEILIAVPQVDLSIGSFDLIEDNGTGKIFLEIQNFSNLPVESVEVGIELENQFSVTEQVNEFIGIGQSTVVSLNVGIPLSIAEPAYFCVGLTSPYSGFSDLDPFNNEKCLTIQPTVKVEDPFPNPVSDEFRLKVITPSEGNVQLILINSTGKIHIERTFSAIQGLNNFVFDMSTLNPGIYYITVDVAGSISQHKVIKL